MATTMAAMADTLTKTAQAIILGMDTEWPNTTTRSPATMGEAGVDRRVERLTWSLQARRTSSLKRTGWPPMLSYSVFPYANLTEWPRPLAGGWAGNYPILRRRRRGVIRPKLGLDQKV